MLCIQSNTSVTVNGVRLNITRAGLTCRLAYAASVASQIADSQFAESQIVESN